MTKYGMASSQVSSVTSPESGGRSEIPNLGGSDSSPILITRHKLNGHNYLQWSQSVLLFICGKGKDEYLTGEAAMPETTEPGFRKWKIENSMIMSWLINSMNNDIGENFLLFGTAKDIWDAAKETYSSSENISELFQVESALHVFRQGEQTVTQYYNTLTRKIVEQKRPFKFFLGLNRELDDVRGRIMGIKPLPSLREAFSEKPGHYKETCWKLHGKPADWKPKPRVDRDGRAHVATNSESTSVPEPSPFNKEQMEMLQKLLSQVGSGNTTGVAFTANRGGMKSWIVDTGASDHMTGDAAILQNYKPSNGHSSVHFADGSKSTIAGTVLNCVPGSTSSHVANSQTKSLKQVAYSLRKSAHFSNLQSYGSKSIQFQNQVLKSDNAKEYFTSSLSTYLQNHGIIHISSWVDTPQQNGVAEHKNKHLLEVARCLMFSSNVPNYFWGEAILTAIYLINRMPSRVLTFQSPRQLFLKQFPHTRAASSDLPLKVFGCTAFVHVYPQNRSKFAPRANKCIFLGYSLTQKGYKCYSPTNKRFYTTMNVSFFEHVFFYPKSHVQGESMNEHQVWESLLEGIPSFHLESPNPSQFEPTELSTPMPSSVQPA
ncbi:Retrovirus-related Pol polyprotein from transposon RE2 [Vitis vinifera]|uniref:Retrovirus-related Pol polyprotein from transposon RE2 n=1 Tax=Vitis vinifera TaxID=29760 RepID=A0A438C3K5_VITVI|nr:Retrovirus-related Pol polyprotein from transposon RE2 [Vitis vinifera]